MKNYKKLLAVGLLCSVSALQAVNAQDINQPQQPQGNSYETTQPEQTMQQQPLDSSNSQLGTNQQVTPELNQPVVQQVPAVEIQQPTANQEVKSNDRLSYNQLTPELKEQIKDVRSGS